MSGLMPKGQKSTVTVLLADQQKISQFSRLHSHGEYLTAKIEGLQARIQSLEDAEEEVMMAEGDDAILLRIGTGMAERDAMDIEEIMQEKAAPLKEQVAVLDAEVQALEKQKTALKAELYSKFGNALNLDP
ncbi:prefoldin beta-like protein [Kipferlia bialata]|uniref:Prefoldin beta-like protein n=1 Tax=Kipferlia bialata TaxID=797122 RepID=A0A391NR58_9EUKA|nr:prefoldin beta-like protein [Kipferlia bialata]|eukprot:g4939.t1